MNLKPFIILAGAIALFAWFRRAQANAAPSFWGDNQMLAFDPQTGEQYLAPIPEDQMAVINDPQPLTFPNWIPEGIAKVIAPSTYWKTGQYATYAGTIAQAEAQYGIPPDLLARLLYQESRYRQDIISGATRSPVGAMGIAQFMPATAAELGVDPLNPESAIDGAGRYLRQLHDATGTWPAALAAYNWGVGNVTKKGLAAAPQETRNYVAQITADVPVA